MMTRTCSSVVASLVVGFSAMATTALAQTPIPTAAEDRFTPDFQPWMGAINADKVRLLAGQYASYYHLGLLAPGDVVRVVGSTNDFLRVELQGPAFKDVFAYVKVSDRDAHLTRVDGRTLRTLGEVRLFAPNMATDALPQDSWKQIHVVPADVRLTIRDTVSTESATYYAVEVPAGATAWVAARYVGHATPAQVRAWEVATGRTVSPPVIAVAEQPVLPRDESALEQPVSSPPVTTESEAVAVEDAELDETVVVAVEVESAEPEPVAVHVKTDEERLGELEAMYAELKKEPIESAEVLPLRELYLVLGEDADRGGVRRYASKRAAQLAIWADLQKNNLEVAELQQRLDLDTDETRQARIFAETTGDYTAVGRLAASTIYDGERLPLLYRLQEPTTRRTIAYVQVGADGTSAGGLDLTSMLGQLVGVIGDRTWDERLKVNRIEPRRLDLLAAME